jgi:hypothetical protein
MLFFLLRYNTDHYRPICDCYEAESHAVFVKSRIKHRPHLCEIPYRCVVRVYGHIQWKNGYQRPWKLPVPACIEKPRIHRDW